MYNQPADPHYPPGTRHQTPKFLFCYGTLRPAGLEARGYAKATHRLPGWQMFDTGPFPYIQPDKIAAKEGVYGNLIEVTEDDMRRFDRYEGAPSFYSREIVEVLDKEGLSTLAYVYQGRGVATRASRHIPSGDWTDRGL